MCENMCMCLYLLKRDVCASGPLCVCVCTDAKVPHGDM